MNDIDHLNHLRSTVLAAGGRWVGLQCDLLDGGRNLVLFQSENTRSCLALEDNEFFTVNAVQDKISESDKKFQNAVVKLPHSWIKEARKDAEILVEKLKIWEDIR